MSDILDLQPVISQLSNSDEKKDEKDLRAEFLAYQTKLKEAAATEEDEET